MKKLYIIGAVAAVAVFFLRATAAAWPGFTTIYGLGTNIATNSKTANG